MADLTEDPHLQTCPDFASTDFAGIRSDIVSAGTLIDPEAAEKLRSAWKTSNDAKKVVWDLQVQRDRDATDAIRQAREQEAEREIFYISPSLATI
ncbi:hypothetical protein DFH07DRAFT_974260 [Mycena maculata]|uniref:Uncharacterized protein n=1 Tax=Mycena maculata TaxID=230809 RepID=A0AAD7H9E4_9AGAR|nr:hypothetical protein DFH07DRAFT_974260 [Mycena maculata]